MVQIKRVGSNRSLRFIWLFAGVLGALMVGGSAAIAGTTVHGTATLSTDGLALSKQPIAVIDSTGVIVQGTTSAAGHFSIKVDSTKAPYLLMSSPTDGSSPLFGIAFATGKANVDVFTDLIAGMLFYAINAQTPTFEFANNFPDAPLLAQWQPISTMLQASMQSWLTTNKVKLKNFSFISTAFTPNSKKKLGRVIAQTTITSVLASGAETIQISDGTNTQDLSLSAGSVNHTVAIASTLNGNANAQQVTVIPADAAQAVEIDDLNSLLQQLQTTVNAKKSKLQVSDVNSLFDPAYLSNGEDDADPSTVQPPAANIAAADLVTQLRGLKMSNIGISKIYSIVAIDLTSDDIKVIYSYDLPNSGFASTTEGFKCPKAGGQCLFFGNQQIADTIPGVQFVDEITSDSVNADNNFSELAVTVAAPTGTLDTTTNKPLVTGPGGTTFFSGSNTANLPLTQQVSRSLSPGGGAAAFNFNEDEFSLETGTLAGVVPAPQPGDVFTLSVSPLGDGTCPSGSASPCVYNSTLTGVTAQPINLISPALGTVADHAIGSAPLGKSLKVTWSLPTTNAVSSISLNGFIADAGCVNTDSLQPTKALRAASTSGTIKYPATLGNGNAVSEASFTLIINNLNGSQSKLIYRWGAC